MTSARKLLLSGFAVIAVAVFATYSGHFNNEFHFDDSHTVVGNPWVRDLRNIPHFFRDPHTYSINPPTQIYRPLTTTSLAIDFWMADGLETFWFHFSTFCWYLVLLALLLTLFRKTLDRANPAPHNLWTALFATALFGLHPVMPETVNYINQRGDIFSTLGAVGGIVVWSTRPGLRRYGVYLIPPLLGIFAKEPTAVFPALLFLWIWLFEEDDLRRAIKQTVPAAIVMGAAAVFIISMEPPSYAPGATSPFNYRISQPAVLLTYFRKFFIPTGLSADTDRPPFTSVFAPGAILGFLFVAAVIAAFFRLRKSREARPIAFGLAWFLIVCLPTSWVGLAEIENDHRMFFPFVGLSLAVCCAAAMWLSRKSFSRPLIASVAALILANCAWGAWQRNKIWRTDESLWYDVTLKSPNNGRGLMNYGLNQMAKGNYQVALDYFQRAEVLAPNYPTLEINLGVVYGAMQLPQQAEAHFQRSIQLDPGSAEGYWFYGRWLADVHRLPEAVTNLRIANEKNPDLPAARHMLMQAYAKQGDAASLRALCQETLARFPSDAEAADWLTKSASLKPEAPVAATPESLLNESLAFYQAAQYHQSIAAAQHALQLRPKFPEAWNNIMSAHNQLEEWDEAIAAGEQAARLDPASERIKNNLAWARSHKTKK